MLRGTSFWVVVWAYFFMPPAHVWQGYLVLFKGGGGYVFLKHEGAVSQEGPTFREPKYCPPPKKEVQLGFFSILFQKKKSKRWESKSE